MPAVPACCPAAIYEALLQDYCDFREEGRGISDAMIGKFVDFGGSLIPASFVASVF